MNNEPGENDKGIEIGKGYIRISRGYIRKSYEDGHYIEAIVLIHHIIGSDMNWTFQTIGKYLNSSVPGRPLKRARVIHDYGFLDMANILFDLGFYNEILYKDLKKFNECRNKVAHRLLTEIPEKSKLDKCYKLGMKLWDDTHKILGKHLGASPVRTRIF